MAAFLVFFVGSGATALVYQVLWLRRATEFFGASAFATSVTLASFMAGLGVGGYLGARWVTRVASPLRMYGWLELALVPAVLLVDLLLLAAAPLFTAMYAADAAPMVLNAARVGVAFLALIVPTTLMGATLPALAQAFVRSPTALARPLGDLYGCNTVGAAAGAFLTGFVLLQSLGVTATRNLAVAITGLIGLLALIASHRLVPVASLPATAVVAAHEGAPRRRSMVLAYGMCGAIALALEVVWVRTLVFYTGSTTYAFTLMLTVLLLGLAAGSFVMSRLADRIDRLHLALAAVLTVAALSTVGGFLVVRALAPGLEAWAVPTPSFDRWLVVTLAIAATALFVPAMAFGAVFPIVGRHEIHQGGMAGDVTGRAYALNLTGSVIGACLGGFVLIPSLGLYRTVQLLSALLLATAFFLWCVEPGMITRRLRTAGALALAGLGGILPALPSLPPLHHAAAGEELIYYSEGASATVSVLQDPTGAKTLFIDRVSVAGTDPVMQTDQKSLAHLPMLLHPNPERVLTVGFGSGGASWSYTRYPMLQHIDCVEIAPEVVKAAPFLREANHDLFDDPRYRVIFDDARAYLQHTPERYDIIATDCTDLRYKGNASLYTSEYFGLCRKRLRPEGLVVVWMPLGGLSLDLFKTALRTFAEALPHVSVWYMNNYPTHYVLLIGSEQPHAIDWETLLARIDLPDVRRDLEAIHLDDPFRLLSTFLLDDRGYREFVDQAAINSDERPLLEFMAPRTAGLFTGADNLESLLSRTGRPAPPLRVSHGEAQRRTIASRLEHYLEAARLVNRGHVHYQTGTRDFESSLDYYRAAAAANPADRHLPELVRATERTRDLTRDAYRSAAEGPAATPGALHNYGLSLLASQPQDALAVFERLAVLRPDLTDAHLGVAKAARLTGQPFAASAAAQRALALAPDLPEAHFEFAIALQEQGDLEGALRHYRRSRDLQPRMTEAYFNAGTILASLGRLHEAQESYRAGLAQGTHSTASAAARVNLAQILLLIGDEAGARTELERAATGVGSAVQKARTMLQSLDRPES